MLFLRWYKISSVIFICLRKLRNGNKDPNSKMHVNKFYSLDCQDLALKAAALLTTTISFSTISDGWRRLGERICHLLENASANFWLTDSWPLTVEAVENKAPFEVLSLVGLLLMLESMLRFSKNETIPEHQHAPTENKPLSEAALDAMIGEIPVSPALKESLATRFFEFLNEANPNIEY